MIQSTREMPNNNSPADSQAYTFPSNSLGLASPPLSSMQSPPMSNYAFSPYNGSTVGDTPMATFAGHVRNTSYTSELGTLPPRVQELETEHNRRDNVRHEMPAESGHVPAPPVTYANQRSESPTPQPRTSTRRGVVERSGESAGTTPRMTSTSREPDPRLDVPNEIPGIPARRSRESSIDKDLPKTPPRTPPPVLVSPDTPPSLVSRFSASRHGAARGLNIMDSLTATSATSPSRMESASLLSSETPGRRSGNPVRDDQEGLPQ